MAEITRWPGGMPAAAPELPEDDTINAACTHPALEDCALCGLGEWCRDCDAGLCDGCRVKQQHDAEIAALARMLADEQAARAEWHNKADRWHCDYLAELAAHAETCQELHAATQRAQRARHMHNSYWRSAHEARMCDLADRNDEIKVLRRQLFDALALLRDVAKAGNLAPAQVAELQRLEGKGDA